MSIVQQKQDWEIRGRSESCSRCQKTFADQEEFYSRLTYGEAGYQREDVCSACWVGVASEPALSIWQSVFRLPPPPPPETLKRETAESLLRKLIEEDRPEHANTIYILAVMLERRRLLVERDVQHREDGVKLRIYEYRKTNETFVIPDPELRLAELEHVQEEVVMMLGGHESAETAAEPVTTAAAPQTPLPDPGSDADNESRVTTV